MPVPGGERGIAALSPHSVLPDYVPPWLLERMRSGANGATNGCTAAAGLQARAPHGPKPNTKKQCLHQDSNPGPTD